MQTGLCRFESCPGKAVFGGWQNVRERGSGHELYGQITGDQVAVFPAGCKGGLGERRSFRIIIRYLAESASELIGGLIDLTAEYGRYDDLLCLV